MLKIISLKIDPRMKAALKKLAQRQFIKGITVTGLKG